MIGYWLAAAGYTREEVEEDIQHAMKRGVEVSATFEEAKSYCSAYGKCCLVWLVQDGKLLWPI